MRQQLKAYSLAAVVLFLFASFLALFALAPVRAANPQPLQIPTPVAAVQRSPSPEFPVFFNTKVITSDTRSSCFEVPDYAVVDLQWIIDQTAVAAAPNTTTLTLQWSNDNANFVDGLAVASNNAADVTDLQQFQLFGRHACLYANVTNENPITITALGVVK